MFISRFWMLLLVVGFSLSLSVLMLARDLVNREREEHAAASVYAEIDKIDVAFTLFSRKRLDVLLSISADSDVRSHLEQISQNSKKRDALRPKLLGGLQKLNDSLGGYRADMLMLVDMDGRVIVKAGDRGRQNDYELKGIPLVDAALRGYVRDDVWQLGKDLYMMAARPVISGNRYVGAVLHGVQITDALATRFSESAQVVFFSGATLVASGESKAVETQAAAANVITAIEELASDKGYKEKGHSKSVRIASGENHYLGAFSRIRGEASIRGAGWGVLVPVEPSIELASIWEEAGKQDIQNLPVVWIVVGAIGLLLIGWFWIYWEAQHPVTKLYKAMVALETADVKDQLNVYKFRRSVRKVAQSFNRVMDFKTKEVLNSLGDGGAGKSVDAILGSAGSSRLSSASFKFAEDLSNDVPPPPPAAAGTPAGNRPLTRPQKPITGPVAALSDQPDPVAEQAYFRKVHQEFVSLKKKLGEPTDQLSFERFETTLRKNSDTLKARYGCTSVKFSVYEKDGKASLKAVPVK